MPKPINLRAATSADIKDMVKTMILAFEPSVLAQRSFPASPETTAYHSSWLEKNLNDPASSQIIIAEEANEKDDEPTSISTATSAPVVPAPAWARWVRRKVPSSAPNPPAAPVAVFIPDMYPRSGDGEYAARFFQANYDATQRIMAGKSYWFLSTIAVRPDHHRRGLASALMKYGLDKADSDNWPTYLNSSLEGKPLYDAFGFETKEVNIIKGERVGYHMVRETRKHH